MTNSNNQTTTRAANETAPAVNPVTLPDGYLADGYTGPTINYVTNWAVEIAEKLAPMDPEIFRKLYWSVGGIPCGNYKARRTAICKLGTIASNLVRKGKAPEILIDFCKANAAAATTPEAVEQFVNHMEAIFCYMN